MEGSAYEKEILQLWFRRMNKSKSRIKNTEKNLLQTVNSNGNLVRGANGSLVVNGSPLVVVSESANDCPFIQLY